MGSYKKGLCLAIQLLITYLLAGCTILGIIAGTYALLKFTSGLKDRCWSESVTTKISGDKFEYIDKKQVFVYAKWKEVEK